MQNPLTPSPKTANRVLHLGIAVISAYSAGGEAVKISDAWMHAAKQVGGDVALSMTIKKRSRRRGRATARAMPGPEPLRETYGRSRRRISRHARDPLDTDRSCQHNRPQT
jgi:hypothetical protein